MAKQTFTTGQVLTAAQMTSLQQTAMGGGSTTAKTASYVLVAADAGTVVQMNSASATTITVNTALFAAGDTVQIQNVGAGVCTVTAGTATVSTSAVLALKQYDAGSLYFNSASAAIFFATDAADSTSPLTTKGDLYTFSTLDARLPVGTNNQILVADNTEATGLKWATPAAAAGMTLISTTTLSGTSVTLSGFSSGYTDLFLYISGVTNATDNVKMRIAPNTTTNLFNYVRTSFLVTGSAANTSGATAGYVMLNSAANKLNTGTSNIFGAVFRQYANAGAFKSVQGFANYIDGSSNAAMEVFSGSFTTNTAITSLVISNDGGYSFSAGTALLYGV